MALTVPSVTPTYGLVTQITSGGHSVAVTPTGGINGGYITNPVVNTDQGISVAEVLYIDPVSTCGGGVLPAANGTVSALQPGDTFRFIAGQTTAVYVNGATSGHKFTVVYW